MSDHWFNNRSSTDLRFSELHITCTREDHHRLRFHYRLYNGVITKIGQHPSFADIAIDESKSYSSLLNRNDVAEFHKAIGLAAHSVGIGSYVYLRRIFERLIQSRFDEFKEAEGWTDEEFRKLRMNERVALLKDHLPAFLVRNAKIYSILSLGVHELDEEECLRFFKTLKQSTIVILEEDKLKQEELARQRELESEIAAFQTPKKGGE
jgi:hypothetical protein